MSHTNTQIGPELPRDVYPILRVATECFLRSFDLLRELDDDMTSGMIVMALWHEELARPGRRTIGVRELSRRLSWPSCKPPV